LEGSNPAQASVPGRVPDDPGRTGPFIPTGTAAEKADPGWPAVPGYEVLGELGSGGMGVVYQARQVGLDRLVALKVVRGGAQARPEFRDRFRAEALAVARLQHPNIIQIYEVGEHQGLPFFALEYADGGSLALHLAGTPQPPDQVAWLVGLLARAMHYAHSRGIVHRDLKPANVLLQNQGNAEEPGPGGPLPAQTATTEGKEEEEDTGKARSRAGRDQTPFLSASSPSGLRGQSPGPRPSAFPSWAPKVTDFGLAKLLDDDSGQTRTGAILGTPSYMAPEQAGGQRQAVGPATDVYALGAILYEMLTGRPPFKAATPFDTVFQVIHDEPVPPRLLQPRVPRDLETICLKCLQKDAGKRYASALHLAEDLRRFRAHEPIRARPVGRAERLVRWCRRHPWEAGLAAALSATLVTVAVVAVVVAARFAEVAGRERAKADESRDRLVRLHGLQGQRLMNDGDLLGSLLPFARALQEDEGEPAREALHRQRLGAVLRQCPRLVRAWPYDATAVTAGFSPDGRRVLLAGVRAAPAKEGTTAGEEGEAIVWDVETAEGLRRPVPYVGRAREGWIALDRDGTRLAAITSQDTFQVLEVASGKSPGSLRHPTIAFLAFSPDGRFLLTASKDGSARLWETDTGREVCPPMAHGGEVWHASFSPDGRRVVTASKDRQACVWDARTGERRMVLDHPDSVNHASFTPDGRNVVTITLRAEARVWDAATGKPVTSPLPGRDQLTPGGLSPEGSRPRAVTIGRDSVPVVWDLATGKPVAPPSAFRGGVTRVSFSPDGRWVVTAGLDGTARVMDAATGRPAAPPLPHGEAVNHAVFAPDGRRVLTVSLDGVVRVWDLAADDPASVPARLSGAPPAESLYLTGERVVALSPDGRRLAWTRWPDHAARLADPATGRESAGPLSHTNWVGQLAFSNDGRLVVTASADKTARVWDAASGAPVGQPLGHGDHVRHASFDPEGRRVVTASVDKTARVWDAATGSALTGPLPHTRTVEYASFSGDGRRLVTVASTEVQVWDAATGEPVGAAIAHRALVAHAALSPDGRYVATGTRDGMARVWEAETGRAVTPPLQHQRAVDHVCFSPDGRLLATASLDGTARVWVTAGGEALTPALRHGFPGKVHAAFTPDGSRLALTGDADKALVWDLSPEGTDPAGMVAVAELLTGERLRGLLGPGREAAERWHEAWQDLRARHPARFTTTGPQVAAWHRRQGADAQKAGDGFAARWQAERLVALRPEDGSAWAALGAAHAEMHHWDEAVAASTKAIELGVEGGSAWYRRGQARAEQGAWSGAAADLQEAAGHGLADWDVWYELALARLGAGDEAGYRATCAGLRERFGKSADVYNANSLAWICVLAPGGADDPAWPIRVAEERVGTDPKGVGWTDPNLNTLGVALYRAGKYPEAVARLDQAVQASHQGGMVQDWLFLAMAQTRLGHADEARKWLNKATAEIDRLGSAGDSGGSSPLPWWTTRLEYQLFRREAERVVNRTTPPGPGEGRDGGGAVQPDSR
jgi:WD40 repeat protein/serine/threonine protein kinase/tetratricopeptide (TPR) repeat protein